MQPDHWHDPADNDAGPGAEYICDMAEQGRRIVVGTEQAFQPGAVMAFSGRRRLVVKRRATRAEFVDNTPEELRASLSQCGAPFYYELELIRL